jgi:hypothetical protein
MGLISRCVLCVFAATAIFGASPANAQYQKYRQEYRATGETWHVEFGVGVWKPPPDIVVSSVALGIIGSDISVQDDLGMQSTLLKEFRLVLRPAKKHKFRLGYIPISYSAETVLKRTIVFNGQAYTVGVPINSSLDWASWTLGYEYDFIYRERGFIGVILEAKYTNATVNLVNPLTTEYVNVKAPIPTIGAVGRVYPVANISITGEFTAFKLPQSSGALKGYDGKYYDFNVYGTLNFTDNFAVQAGYRSLAVAFRKDQDSGDLVLKGPYTMGVVRF